MFASWDPLFPRGKAEQSEIKSMSLIPVGVQPEQALLQDQRAVEFDPQAGVGGALCLGEVGPDRIARLLEENDRSEMSDC